MHGACYVKLSKAEAAATCAPDEPSRSIKSPLLRLCAALRVAASAEFRNAGRIWTPAFATVSNTVAHTVLVALALAKSETVRAVAARIHLS